MSDDIQEVKLKCDIYWAFTSKPNDMSGKYQVNLCNLSDSACAALADMGIDVADASDAVNADGEPDENKRAMGKYITCKSNSPIWTFDADGDRLTEDVKIGNGSKAKALIRPYDWKYKNKKGTSASCRRLMITDLVEYESAGDGGLDDDDVL